MTDSTKQTDTSEKNIIKTSVLKVEGKTMIFGSTVYQIPNISIMSVVDLSTIKPPPSYFQGLNIGIVFALVIGTLAALASVGFIPEIQLTSDAQYAYFRVVLMTFALAAVLFIMRWLGGYFYSKNRHQARYGMQIILNAGLVSVFVSNDREFLIRVALTLIDIMNGQEQRPITFNFDQRNIVDNASGSVVSFGNVGGDIVNNV